MNTQCLPLLVNIQLASSSPAYMENKHRLRCWNIYSNSTVHLNPYYMKIRMTNTINMNQTIKNQYKPNLASKHHNYISQI